MRGPSGRNEQRPPGHMHMAVESAYVQRVRADQAIRGNSLGLPRSRAHPFCPIASTRSGAPRRPFMPPSCLWRRPLPTSTHARLAQPSRPYSASTHNKTPSRHALFYSDLVPGMIPVALLGSAIYLVRLLCLPVFPI